MKMKDEVCIRCNELCQIINLKAIIGKTVDRLKVALPWRDCPRAEREGSPLVWGV